MVFLSLNSFLSFFFVQFIDSSELEAQVGREMISVVFGALRVGDARELLSHGDSRTRGRNEYYTQFVKILLFFMDNTILNFYIERFDPVCFEKKYQECALHNSIFAMAFVIRYMFNRNTNTFILFNRIYSRIGRIIKLL